MSNYSAQQLYTLLPAIYRQRDAEQGHALRDLIELIAEQAVVVERDIFQLYENWFIETCDKWVVPYLGDLIGVRGTHPIRFSRRAEVANTIGYRRRKGTAAVLEQLARDSTGWKARVVEFFELLATTQHVNHIRPHNYRTPDLHRMTALKHLNGPFDTAPHTAEVRAIHNRRGRYNIPNVGLFLWRLTPYTLEGVTPHEFEDGTGLHYTFSVLGNDAPLFNLPETEPSPAHIAEEINVPAPIRRRALLENPEAYYGTSILIEKDGEAITSQNIVACDLTEWAHEPPPGQVAIDPVLGRLAFAPGDAPPPGMRVKYHYGFSADIGAGQYEREASFHGEDDEDLGLFRVGTAEMFRTLSLAREAWVEQGSPRALIEIVDSATYEEALVFNIPADGRLVIRAANRQRPTLLLAEDQVLQITGGEGCSVELNGLLIAGVLRVDGALDRLRLQHCTLVPGLGLTSTGEPLHPSRPSLIVASPQAEVTVSRCILGAIRAHVDAEVELYDSILDANGPTSTAYDVLEGVQEQGGGPLKVSRCTVIGTIHTRVLSLGENSIFLGQVVAEQRQTGCVRFSYVAPGSRVPSRHRCQPLIPAEASPEEAERIAARMTPQFTSLRYGDPGYCQLPRSCPEAIRRGAEDESEMGVFSSQQQPQREDNLLIRLEEYLRFGLEAGIFYVT